MSSDDNSAVFSQLRIMYKRYMMDRVVADWLLRRTTTTNFDAFRRDASVMLRVNSAGPPKLIPSHAPPAKFPASHDLMCVDHMHHTFALGHIWGNVNCDTHSYSHLPSRVGLTGWQHVQSRKFACDLSVDGALEMVEVAWFTDNSAIVILSRVPCLPHEKAVRHSEVIYYPPQQHFELTPQRERLVLTLTDHFTCPECSNDICTCPNSQATDRSAANLVIITSPGPRTPNADRAVQSWQHRARLIAYREKRGLLSINYPASSNYDGITVRQSYVSLCDSQDAIAERIQQYWTKLLSRDAIKSTPTQTVSTLAPFPSEDSRGLPHELQVESPISFTQRDVSWFESPRVKLNTDKAEHRKQPCCSSHNATPKSQACPTNSDLATPHLRIQLANRTCSAVSLDAPSAAALLSPTSEPGRHIDGPLPRKTDSFTTTVAGSAAANVALNSICGPEKGGEDCKCSPEKMQDKSLAMILCSPKGGLPGSIGDISLLDPLLASSAGGNRMLMRPTTPLAREALAPGLHDDVPARLDPLSQFNSSALESQLTDSTRVMPSTTVLRPMPSGEPALKRQRTNSLIKTESLGFSLDAGWSPTLDNGEKGLLSPAWGLNGGSSIERPLSSLGRVFSVPHGSPSPPPLIPSMIKTPSPPVPPLSSVVPNLRPNEFDFQSAFGTLPGGNISGMSGLDTNSISDTCCEICGLQFAKRSNKKRHIETVHNRIKQFSCDLCDQKFGHKADLGRHRYRIHESRVHRCDKGGCGKSFADQAQLDQHIRVEHGEDSKPFSCGECNMRFGRKSSLNRHQQNVHQRMRYNCRICDKSYSQKHDVVRHERRVHEFSEKEGSAGIKAVRGV